MSSIDFKPALDTDEWEAWGHWLRNEPGHHEDRIWKELLQLLEFVHYVHCHYDFGKLNVDLFVPFGGKELWNRKVSLMVMEINNANGRHLGKPDEKDFLSGEWAVSGLHRPVFAHARGELGDGGDPVDIPDDELETEQGVVE